MSDPYRLGIIDPPPPSPTGLGKCRTCTHAKSEFGDGREMFNAHFWMCMHPNRQPPEEGMRRRCHAAIRVGTDREGSLDGAYQKDGADDYLCSDFERVTVVTLVKGSPNISVAIIAICTIALMAAIAAL